MSQEWIDDCMQTYGRVLTGKYAHFCYEWDGLPIDETCEEFQCCCCYPTSDQQAVRERSKEDWTDLPHRE